MAPTLEDPITTTDSNGTDSLSHVVVRGPSSTLLSPLEDENSTAILTELYAENITAKILAVAEKHLQNNDPPNVYPEVVPQSGEKEGIYSHRVVDFWTSGFFPGSIWGLVERATKYPQSMRHEDTRLLLSHVRDKLELLGRKWSEPLHFAAHRTDSHDLGFMILPHMRPRWELFHDREALSSICTAAASLYSRFDARVGAIRSWDCLMGLRHGELGCMKENFLVIIDSMCNLDLLYYAAAHTGYKYLADAATTHATTLLKTHLRPEPGYKREGYDGMLYSTLHVANFAPSTGELKETFTAQGHKASSTWSRGQGWAILGYAQAFEWTGNEAFLEAVQGAAEYFLLRMEEAPSCVEILTKGSEGVGIKGSRPSRTGRYVPLWDFDAPIENTEDPMRDASAGVVAANGMLILAQALMKRGLVASAERYLKGALRIVSDTLGLCLSDKECRLQSSPGADVSAVDIESLGAPFQAILRNSSVTWNALHKSRSGYHGLVYADYYLIEFGNRLLQLGYGPGLSAA